MAVLAREDDRAAGTADGVRAEGIVEEHPFRGEPIEVRGLDQVAAVGADRVVGVVIAHDEHDIGAFWVFRVESLSQ